MLEPRRELDLPPSWREFARMAAPLVGVPRHLSVHPGGVVIVPTALTDYVPIEPAVKALENHPDLTVPVIQFEKDGAEDAGLVKIDLLGNRSLAVIRDGIATPLRPETILAEGDKVIAIGKQECEDLLHSQLIGEPEATAAG